MATRRIAAPVEAVFRTVTDVGCMARAVPALVGMEVLQEVEGFVGSRVRERRRVLGLTLTTDFEATEFVQDERMRAVANSGGFRWDTVFAFARAGEAGAASSARAGGGSGRAAEATDLTMVMEATPTNPLARLVLPLALTICRRAMAQDLDGIQAWCEGGGSAG